MKPIRLPEVKVDFNRAAAKPRPVQPAKPAHNYNPPQRVVVPNGPAPGGGARVARAPAVARPAAPPRTPGPVQLKRDFAKAAARPATPAVKTRQQTQTRKK
jgi:hypothetical protein